MKLQANVLSKIEWKWIEKAVHEDIFGDDYKGVHLDYNYAVLVLTEDGERFSYSLVKELDRDTAYLPYGGMFKMFRGYNGGYRGFHEIIEKLKKSYTRIGFATRTTNIPMIKLGLNEGFIIIGLRKVFGLPNVEFLLERGK